MMILSRIIHICLCWQNLCSTDIIEFTFFSHSLPCRDRASLCLFLSVFGLFFCHDVIVITADPALYVGGRHHVCNLRQWKESLYVSGSHLHGYTQGAALPLRVFIPMKGRTPFCHERVSAGCVTWWISRWLLDNVRSNCYRSSLCISCVNHALLVR